MGERPTRLSDFGTLLRRYRLAAGLSQEALAERARLSTEGISALERGFRRTPQRGTLALLADALAIDGDRRRDFEEAAARRVLLGRKGAPVVVGPWPDLAASALPLTLTAFVGRETELEEIAELLRNDRLVTLTGAGGIGKTRTALQVTRSLNIAEDATYFVALAPLADASLVATTMASALRVQEVPNRPLLETLLVNLKSRAVLLILDNCEHLITETARIVEALLLTCPQVRILATSREPLRVAGERCYRLPSLNARDAMILFRDRARGVDHRFALDSENTPIVVELCQRLDGIPLAIELAAAHVNALTAKTLGEMLDHRFRISGGARTALPRQHTMRATIDWSYDLLAPQEQLLFARLGIFAGGFRLDGVTTVCGGDSIEETEILNLLVSLTDKSMVVADTSGEEERYRLLESTRAYALERLTASGERERLAHRHAGYFRDQAHEADERWGTGSNVAWLATVERELDNYRAVLEWALKDEHDMTLGGAVAGALSSFWFASGLGVEGRHWISLAQARLDESMHALVAARMWTGLSWLCSGMRKHDCAQRALVLSQAIDDETGQHRALASVAYSLVQMGQLEEASAVNARALAMLRALGHKPGVAGCLNLQGMIQQRRGDVVAAREVYARALAAYKALGDDAGIAAVLANLAELEFGDREVEQAVRLANESLQIMSRGKNASDLAIGYNNIAAYRIPLGDVDGARAAAREGLRLARQVQRPLSIAVALQHLALLLALRGEVSAAARLVGYMNLQFKELGIEREATEKWGYEKLIAVLREKLGEAQIENLAAESAAWSEDQAVEEALKI